MSQSLEASKGKRKKGCQGNTQGQTKHLTDLNTLQEVKAKGHSVTVTLPPKKRDGEMWDVISVWKTDDVT